MVVQVSNTVHIYKYLYTHIKLVLNILVNYLDYNQFSKISKFIKVDDKEQTSNRAKLVNKINQLKRDVIFSNNDYL